MSAFQSPNYTQTPNDFFAMLPDMEASEVRVTLVMIRQTFGFHRDGFKMGISKLADAAGLSRNAAKDGAEAAEKRGTFKRTNPEEQTEAEWSLVVEDGQSVTTPSQPVEGGRSISDSQVRVKESIKKELKNRATPPTDKPKTVKAQDFPSNVLYREVTERYPQKATWHMILKATTDIENRLGRPPIREDLFLFYENWVARGFNPVNLAWLTNWAVRGVIPEYTSNGKQSEEIEKPLILVY